MTTTDPQAPYVCLGCSKVFEACPDFDAYDCPDCGEKVCPARLWHRAVLRCQHRDEDGCGCEAAERTDGRCKCPKCGLEHRLHPYCANSKLGPNQSSSTFPEYFLHVLCDGRHVKL